MAKVERFEKVFAAALFRARDTGKNQWVAVPAGRMVEAVRGLAAALDTIETTSWLRKWAKTPTGIRIEVLDSYAESKRSTG